MFRSLIFPAIFKVLQSVGTTKARMTALRFVPMLLFMIGGLFTLISIHEYISKHYGSLIANIVFATLFIILGLIVEGYLSYQIERQERLRKHSNLTENVIREASNLVGFDAHQATRQVKSVMRDHGAKVLLGTVVAGLLLGRYGRNPWENR